jgi:hypothetical protein
MQGISSVRNRTEGFATMLDFHLSDADITPASDTPMDWDDLQSLCLPENKGDSAEF